MDCIWAVSSAVEHYVDIVGVTGSIPVSPTIARKGTKQHTGANGAATQRKWA